MIGKTTAQLDVAPPPPPPPLPPTMELHRKKFTKRTKKPFRARSGRGRRTRRRPGTKRPMPLPTVHEEDGEEEVEDELGYGEHVDRRKFAEYEARKRIFKGRMEQPNGGRGGGGGGVNEQAWGKSPNYQAKPQRPRKHDVNGVLKKIDRLLLWKGAAVELSKSYDLRRCMNVGQSPMGKTSPNKSPPSVTLPPCLKRSLGTSKPSTTRPITMNETIKDQKDQHLVADKTITTAAVLDGFSDRMTLIRSQSEHSDSDNAGAQTNEAQAEEVEDEDEVEQEEEILAEEEQEEEDAISPTGSLKREEQSKRLNTATEAATAAAAATDSDKSIVNVILCLHKQFELFQDGGDDSTSSSTSKWNSSTTSSRDDAVSDKHQQNSSPFGVALSDGALSSDYQLLTAMVDFLDWSSASFFSLTTGSGVTSKGHGSTRSSRCGTYAERDARL
ncbi:hypothetical protein ACA910_010016 [Epithemia clementina (nom. ined.)]